MTTKKRGLGKGMDALIIKEEKKENNEMAKRVVENDEAGEAVAQVAIILNDVLANISKERADRMLRMIISMCRTEMTC